MTTTLEKTYLRWMIRRDMDEVLDIDRTGGGLGWDAYTFATCLRQRNCIGMVCKKGERAVGFMVYEIHKIRLTLKNFAVKRTHRRVGVGAMMVDKLRTKITTHRRKSIDVVVPESLLPAQLFFRSCGFEAVAIIPEAFGDEDGYRLVWKPEVPDVH